MSVSRIFAIVLRQFYIVRGSFARLFPLFAWAGIDMILWGFLTRYLNNFVSSGFNFVPMLLGAVLLWDFFIRIMQGVTMAFFEDVWSNNFINVFASPLLISEYVLGLVISSIATSMIGLTVMLFIVVFFFKLSLLIYGIMAVPFILVLFLFGISIGVFGSALVLHLGPASEWFIWPIPALISPFVGVLYPISTLPHWMQLVARFLPPSYVFEGLRAIVLGKEFSGITLVWGGCLAVLYIFLAYMFFVKIYKHSLHTGLLVRHSAETLN
ncbi:MAG: ABC transporter permease [Candidatus Omnitrophica bacterium]|nr:ABC transporter permease [Candidatus Omnitrophota bacterium]